MPRISYFRGIAIYMYWDEGAHATPHFHAHHAGRRASVDLEGRVLAGDIDSAALGHVQEWARMHREELLSNWDRACRSEPILPIEPPGIRFEAMGYLPAVVGVAVIGDHRLRLLFDDGTAGDVDLSRMEWRGVFEPLRDPKYFAQVKVDPDAATVVWPNGADLAPETLYAEARKNPLIAA